MTMDYAVLFTYPAPHGPQRFAVSWHFRPKLVVCHVQQLSGIRVGFVRSAGVTRHECEENYKRRDSSEKPHNAIPHLYVYCQSEPSLAPALREFKQIRSYVVLRAGL